MLQGWATPEEGPSTSLQMRAQPQCPTAPPLVHGRHGRALLRGSQAALQLPSSCHSLSSGWRPWGGHGMQPVHTKQVGLWGRRWQSCWPAQGSDARHVERPQEQRSRCNQSRGTEQPAQAGPRSPALKLTRTTGPLWLPPPPQHLCSHSRPRLNRHSSWILSSERASRADRPRAGALPPGRAHLPARGPFSLNCSKVPSGAECSVTACGAHSGVLTKLEASRGWCRGWGPSTWGSHMVPLNLTLLS